MAGNVKLEIVTPDKAVVNEEVKIIMAPGSLGEFGVVLMIGLIAAIILITVVVTLIIVT